VRFTFTIGHGRGKSRHSAYAKQAEQMLVLLGDAQIHRVSGEGAYISLYRPVNSCMDDLVLRGRPFCSSNVWSLGLSWKPWEH